MITNLKVKLKSIFAVLLAFCVLTCTIHIEAMENELNKTEQIISTRVAPDNYVPIEDNEQISSYSIQNNNLITDKKVVLIQDTLPWSTNSNEEMLNSLGISYDKVTTTSFLSCDLSQYAVVIFANDQQFSAYSNYKEFKEYLELFTELGGVIVFGAADNGWANGSLVEMLPGNVRKTSRYVLNNYIVDFSHPIVKGNLSDDVLLLNEDLYETYTSHSCFIESSLPAGSKVILRDSDRNEPTLVEYPLGDGRVIASGLTWEYNYFYKSLNRDGKYSGRYADKAFDDLFLYAIKVSTINQHDITPLKKYWLSKTQHTIAVLASDTNQGIKAAEVRIDGNTYLTDENGLAMISVADKLKTTVEVKADGYGTALFKYTLQPQKAHIFVLNPDNGGMRPYCTMVEEESSEYDLYSEKLYYMENETTVCKLLICADWRGKTPGQFVLYQEGELGGERGICIKQQTGVFNLIPGKTFNPGQPVMLKLIALDGTESIPIQIGIIVNKNSKIDDNIGSNGDLMNQTSLVIGSPQSGVINDDKITAVFPNNFDFKISSLPINVKGINNSKDGTYTVRMQIGLGNSNYLKDDTKWDTFKKDLKDAAESTDRANRLAGLMQAYDSQLSVGSFSIISQWSPYLKGMGYYEETYDTEGNIVSQSGGIIICGGGSYSYTRQFLAGPVPIYINLKGAVELSTTQGLKYGANGFEYDGKINFIPSISLSGGLGIKGVASVGVGGGARMNIQIQPSSSASITLNAFIEASLIFVFNFSYDIGATTIPLWPTENSMGFSLTKYLSENEPDVHLSNIEYAERTTSWNQSVIEQNKIISLQDWILPGTIPILEQIDNKTILIFQTTDNSREQINSTVLMYSVYENGCFSQPQPVYISDSADLFASVISYNNNVYLIWQKQGIVTDNQSVDAMLGEALSKTEIYFSKWNNQTNQFDSVTAITDNNTLDMLPRIAVKDNEISIVWVNNTENNPFGLAGEYAIMKSVYKNNTWSEPQKIYGTNKFISELTVDYDKFGKLSVAFTAYNAITQDYSDVYILNDYGSIQITDNESEESGLQFFEDSLYWESDGSVKEYNLTDGSLNTIILQDDVVNSSFKVLKSDTKVAMCWSDGEIIKVSIKVNEKWSEPIVLCESKGMTINNLDTLLLSDNSWFIVMNIKGENDKTSIGVLHVMIQPDLSLDYVFASDAKRIDGIQQVEFAVTNKGETTVTRLNISVKTNEATYLDKEIFCNVVPGETSIFIEEFELNEIDKVTDFNMEVHTEDETYYENNIQSFQLGYTDIALSVNQLAASDKIILAIGLSNLSDTSVQTTISIMEDNEEGIALDMKNVGTIESKGELLYLYSINKDNIDFSDKKAKHYYIKADTSIEDYNSLNNFKYIVVYPDIELTPSDEEMRELELINVTEVNIESQDITLILSDKDKVTSVLSAVVFPRNATYQQVEWSVENPEIVSVEQDGTITGLTEGRTKVTAKSIDGNFTDAVDVTVLKEEPKINVTGIQLNTNKIELVHGNSRLDSYQFVATVFPLNATNKNILWSVDNKNIAIIDQNGVVHAVSQGNTIVRAVTLDGNFSASALVTVKNNTVQNNVKIYFSNNKNWSNVYAYCFKSGTNPVKQNAVWPGIPMTYKTQNIYNEQIYEIEIDANMYDYIVFNDGYSQQTVDIPITAQDGIGYYITYNSNNKYNVESYDYNDETQTIYFTDNYNWGNVHAYCFKSGESTVIENVSWPGQQMTYVKTNGYGEKIYAITIQKNKYDYIIFSNGSSNKQTVDIYLDVPRNTGFYISGSDNNKYFVTPYSFS